MKKKNLWISTIIAVLALSACGEETNNTEHEENISSYNEEIQSNSDSTINEDAMSSANEESVAPPADGNNRINYTTQDCIGYRIDGYKTEVSIYGEHKDYIYDSPEEEDTKYLEAVEEYALNWYHENGYPDITSDDLELSRFHSLKHYVYLTNDWKGIIGMAYKYGFFCKTAPCISICYDPRADLMFVSENVVEKFSILAAEKYNGIHTAIDVYGDYDREGHVDEGVDIENYIDFAVVVGKMTGLGAVLIKETEDTDPDALAAFYEYVDKYGTREELNALDCNRVYDFSK